MVVGAALAAPAAHAAGVPEGASKPLDGVVAKPGEVTTFYRDTLWKFPLPKGDRLVSVRGGGVQIQGADGEALMSLAPESIRDTAGGVHKVTWTVEGGDTLRQHIDVDEAKFRGVMTPHAVAYGFMDWVKCVGKQSQDTAIAGGVAGCVAGLETGCVAGAGVGGVGGALGGAVVGMKNC
ncbi:hypothetical protein AB0K09_20615 [Streptomyces sp. NPDC049577]|uniref:hypothetical protein n=1 Tax=Streptomyces sp. NPDC049577 TaxID=3155153 RepID=UPI003424E58F